jgi:hypothetical protein
MTEYPPFSCIPSEIMNMDNTINMRYNFIGYSFLHSEWQEAKKAAILLSGE